MKTTDNENGGSPELAILTNKLKEADARIAALEAENRGLRDEIAVLKSAMPPDVEAGEFTEASGVLWKRKRSGGYESFPYCPTCKSTLADYSGSLLCLKCNWQAPIKSFEAPKVHHDLSGGRE